MADAFFNAPAGSRRGHGPDGNASLVFFTLMLQGAVGLVSIRAVGHWCGAGLPPDISFPPLATALGLAVLGLVAALAHLARPRLAPYALSNPSRSWLSREVLLATAFTITVALASLTSLMAAATALLFLEGAAFLYINRRATLFTLPSHRHRGLFYRA